LRYALPEAAHVSIRVYCARSTLIAIPLNHPQPAGYHELPILPASMGSGKYLVVFEAGKRLFTEKITLIR
jgi:hypothetical protein